MTRRLEAEIYVDSFAGGGGASKGMEMALGRGPDIAINHDAEAIALHQANHPETQHYTEDVWKVDPVTVCAGRPVGLMWLSPDCKHFSKAKGGKPVSKRVRGLAWVAVRWAVAVKPRIIVLENVEEFQGWGPVSRETQRPDPLRKGHTFKRFTGRLRNLGYVVEWRELRACDYGAPTIRKRLFLIARRDGEPIVWPKPTHGKGHAQPWHTAAECIDFDRDCPSIFARKKPLAENTLKRIGAGLRRFVFEADRPFIVEYHSAKRPGDDSVVSIDKPLPTSSTENRFGLVEPYLVEVQNSTWGGKPIPLDAPMRTITAHPKGGGHALVEPFLVPLTHHGNDARIESLGDPMKTVTGAHRGETALITPLRVPRYGERDGQAPRAASIEKPMPTIVPTQNGASLVAGFIAKHYTDVIGATLFAPMPTVTSIDHNALVTATLSGEATRQAQVNAFIVAYFGNEKDGGSLFDPMRTVTSKDRFGLVTVEGIDYRLVDIGMRMLAPRELYRAQGFPDSYKIDIPFTNPETGKTAPMTKKAQVRMCGNSVCPPIAAAIIAANVTRVAREVAA